jgi:hypothetical protein
MNLALAVAGTAHGQDMLSGFCGLALLSFGALVVAIARAAWTTAFWRR